MIIKLFKTCIVYSVISSLLVSPCYAQKKSAKFNLKELVLPSEVKNINKRAGAIYYSPSVKDKVLVPVHMWGSIANSGLHFLPIDTPIINGISLAGGPTALGKLSNIKLNRKESGKIKSYYFDLSDGGDQKAFDMTLKPGDTIFIEKSNFIANRAYYTGLISIVATVLSSILLFREVRK